MDLASIASSTRPAFAAEPLVERRSVARTRFEAAPRPERSQAHHLAVWRLLTLLLVVLATADSAFDLPQLRWSSWVAAVLVAGAAALLAAAAAEAVPASLLHESAPVHPQTIAEHAR